jgi:hypothetical protein
MQYSRDLIASLRESWAAFITLLPDLAAAALIPIAGWLIARTARRVAIRFLRFLRVDVLAERAGVEGFLMMGGVEFTTVTILGGLVYWTILFLTFVVLLNVVTASSGTVLLEQVVRFVPKVVAAVIVLVFGTVVARFVGAATHTYLNNMGSRSANAIAALARVAILVFVLAIAVEQLAISSPMLVFGFEVAFAALCLALALAFGFGGREWAGRVLDRLWKV